MSPNCSFLEFLAYIPEKSSKFGIFSSQNETEIMFFWGPIGIFGLISSVWDVFNRIQSYLEPGNLKSSFFGNFKFEANFAHFLASKNDYSHKSAIFSWKKPKWSKKDENMYKVYRKYKKNGFQNTLKMAKMCSLRGTVGGVHILYSLQDQGGVAHIIQCGMPFCCRAPSFALSSQEIQCLPF